jgi:hypothetical protein
MENEVMVDATENFPEKHINANIMLKTLVQRNENFMQ